MFIIIINMKNTNDHCIANNYDIDNKYVIVIKKISKLKLV